MSKSICKSCGKEITTGKKDYCSKSCKKSFNVIRTDLFPSETKKCLKCGKSFGNKPSNFCSLECATSYSLIMGEVS